MNTDFLYQFLKNHGQESIMATVSHMPSIQKKQFLQQIQEIASQNYQGLDTGLVLKNISTVQKIAFAGSKKEIQIGLKTLLENQTGCLIFSGGQATRLNAKIPKGLSSIRGKSLFEHICIWILAYNLAFDLSIPLIILVSKNNKRQIQEHFENNACFGLDPGNIMLLEQGEYPYFDEMGKWIIKDGAICQAPNGNGGVFDALQKVKAKQFLKDHRLKYLHLIPIDNPLNDPLDINLLGFLKDRGLDAVIKVFPSNDRQEKVGRIYQDKGKHLIVDYMELSEDGKKQLEYANGGHYCIKLSSLFELEKTQISLPYHFVKKKVSGGLLVWKGEKFVFDLFPHLSKVSSLCYEKKQFFAPLKEVKDVIEIEAFLKQRDRDISYILKKPSQSKWPLKDLARYLTEVFRAFNI